MPLFVACLAAALALFFSAVLPLAGTLSLVTPLPIAFCYWRQRRAGVAVVLAGTLVVALPGGAEWGGAAMMSFLELGAAGVVLGELARRKAGPGLSLTLALLAAVAAAVGFLLVHAAFFGGQSLFGLVQGYQRQAMADLSANLVSLGYGPDSGLNDALAGLSLLLPSMLLLSVGSVLWLNIVLLRKLAVVMSKRLGKSLDEDLAEWPDFRCWRAPEPLIWLPIAAGALSLIPDATARLVGMNVLAVAAVIYFVQGLAIAAFYLGKTRLPRPLRFVTYAALIFYLYLSLAVVAAGLFDLWIDFRRLKRAAVEEA
ncbi:MAG: DUF2232 domain-containing protein [Pseudomonadota bacterium]